MRRALASLAMVTIAFFNLGMGELGSAPQTGIPTPEQESRAVIVDQAGSTIELERFTMDGRTAVEGTLGKGRVSIPFKNIRKVEFPPDEEDGLPARIVLDDGREIALGVRPTETFFGDTGFGTYTIRARDLKTIEFR